MAQSNRKPITGQNPLFTIPPTGGENQSNIKTWQEIEGSPANRLDVLVGDNIGPHIKITERAERLIGAMNALAHRNMLIGFDEAVLDPRHKRPIWERYLDGTPIVIDRSQSKTEQLLEEAMRDFWYATGFTALQGSGIFTNGQVRTKARRGWRAFSHRIGDPRVHNDLVKFRKQQRKFLPDNHPYQTVTGWRNEKEAGIRRAAPVVRHLAIVPRSSPVNKPEADGVAISDNMPPGPLPERKVESDEVTLRESAAMIDRIERQMETRRQSEISHRNAILERAQRALEETNY